MNVLPFRLNSLALTLGLVYWLPAQAQDWDCRQNEHGEWVCGSVSSPLAEPIEQPPASKPVPAAIPAAPVAEPTPASEVEDTTTRTDVPRRINPGYALCPPLPDRQLEFPVVSDRTQATTQLNADIAESHPNQVYELSGNAVILRANQRVQADHILFDDLNGSADIEGHVRYDEPDVHLNAERAHLLVNTDEGEIHDTDYLLYTNHARGESSTVYLEGPDRKRMLDATYTTCAYGSDAWRLRASQVTLKHDEGVGIARNARLEVNNVPILYTPYISFPIDDRRKSGFLIPSFGSSDESGFDLRLPYYWNIAPNRDATITPRYMEKRGLMLGTEVRYLNPHNEGQLDYSILPSDDAYGADRHLAGYRHTGTLGERLQLEADLSDVSDQDYFQDFGDSLELTSITHLERRLDATYRGDWWSLKGRLQNYQTVDSTIAATNRPYERLPQISFSARPYSQPFGLESSLLAEVTAFDHSRAELVDTGNRIDLRPRVSLPLRRTAYEVIPALTLAHTQYDLDRIDPTLDDQPSRTAPIFSLDNKVFFERDTRLFGSDYLQTLEPRAFYLYAPYRDQTDIPVFDSADRTFRFRELFAENRFTGGDRLGDANQLALALTSRYIDPRTGTEKLRASIGELFYFEDREVTLNNGTPLETSTSDIAGELEVALSPRWSLSADALWNPDDGTTRKSNTGVEYRGTGRQLANLSYRYTKDSLAQLDASWLWPLTARWHLAGRWNYSLKNNETLEALFGAEYDSCCWALRMAWRSIQNDSVTGENNNALFLEWELKGMTSLGDKVESLLKSGILGYRP